MCVLDLESVIQITNLTAYAEFTSIHTVDCTELLISIFTGRNEVVAKVMFLHVSVILLTGGGRGSPGRTPP